MKSEEPEIKAINSAIFELESEIKKTSNSLEESRRVLAKKHQLPIGSRERRKLKMPEIGGHYLDPAITHNFTMMLHRLPRGITVPANIQKGFESLEVAILKFRKRESAFVGSKLFGPIWAKSLSGPESLKNLRSLTNLMANLPGKEGVGVHPLGEKLLKLPRLYRDYHWKNRPTIVKILEKKLELERQLRNFLEGEKKSRTGLGQR